MGANIAVIDLNVRIGVETVHSKLVYWIVALSDRMDNRFVFRSCIVVYKRFFELYVLWNSKVSNYSSIAVAYSESQFNTMKWER